MIRVLIVDDSAVVRNILKTILNDAPGIEVVGVAADPYFARDKFKTLKPDVVTLDVEMPRMDGLTFLSKLMSYRPVPVVMISSLTQRGAETTLKALSLGAVDFIGKPSGSLQDSLASLSQEIVEKVRTAAGANVAHTQFKPLNLKVEEKLLIDQVMAGGKAKGVGVEPVICIGASTGGTVAIEALLRVLPRSTPGILVVQHMPAGFTNTFAERLDSTCDLEVLEAQSGMKVKRGRAIIAAGGIHLLLQKDRIGYQAQLKDGPPVNRHKPSVDVLFRSAANVAGNRTVAAILTGMGDDGARGMKDLCDAGAFTVAQNESSCVVYGMPKAAKDFGGVRQVAALEAIPKILLEKAR